MPEPPITYVKRSCYQLWNNYREDGPSQVTVRTRFGPSFGPPNSGSLVYRPNKWLVGFHAGIRYFGQQIGKDDARTT